MKFGKIDNPGEIAFFLPPDHKDTNDILSNQTAKVDRPNINIGCAKWNKQYLKSFYPKGIGNKELEYYSSHFNCIEMNAFFYRIFPIEMVQKWYDRSADDFLFHPKIPQTISQFRRLKNCDDKVDQFLSSVHQFKEKLGTCFLQMHPTFGPDKLDDLESFITKWPKDVALSVEVRHPEWYSNEKNSNALYQLIESHNITHTITDTSGRRDMLHMRLSTPKCFVRFTGSNHDSDYQRIDQWYERLKLWIDLGIQEINFFIHQNTDLGRPFLADYFIQRLNKELGYNLVRPID